MDIRHTPAFAGPPRPGPLRAPRPAALRAGSGRATRAGVFAVAATVLASVAHHVADPAGPRPGVLAAVAATAFLLALPRAGRQWSHRSAAALMCATQIASHLLLSAHPSAMAMEMDDGRRLAQGAALVLHAGGTVAVAALLHAADARACYLSAAAGRIAARLLHLLARAWQVAAPAYLSAGAVRRAARPAHLGAGRVLTHAVRRRGPPAGQR
ncbi:hypothetical protein [Kitasatospora cineracea]|uniref:Uncharacterized protein n=1 Tax=Kitasatospora cineracea TaxID=88074 RepID=A0A8G1UFG0_9ACTN|nr:hypothetical protein [Kitasatospora cineracea]ROR43015.1 hypothetical protein EDD39_1150 [Kitasatospora cineracea]